MDVVVAGGVVVKPLENRAQTPGTLLPIGDADAADHRIRAGIGMRELRGQPFRRDDGVRVGVRQPHVGAQVERVDAGGPGGPDVAVVDDSLDDAHLPATGRHHRGSVVGAGVEDDADHDGQARELRRRDDGVDAGGDAVAFVVGGDDHDDAGDPGRCGVVRRTHGGYGGASTGPIRGAHGGYGGLLADVFRGTLLVRAPHSAHHTPLSAGWRGISPPSR